MASVEGYRLKVVFLPCIAGEPGNPAPASVGAILDPTLREPGESGPVQNRADVFQIRVNPTNSNLFTLIHEIFHVARGHSAASGHVPFGLHGAANAVLDIAFVDPALLTRGVWHDGWSVVVAILLLIALGAAYLSAGLKQRE